MREILTINAGSSSIKFSLFVENPDGSLDFDMRGNLSGLGYAPLLETHDANGENRTIKVPGLDDSHLDAEHVVGALIDWLIEGRGLPKLSAVGHRVVHGGEISAPRVIDDALLDIVRGLVSLAPLHVPANLAGIEAARRKLPDVPQVACFDTAFHARHDPVDDLFALPADIRAAGVRRYGYHGLSCESAIARLSEIAPERAAGPLVIAHLGSGASVSASRQGIGVASSMGMSSVDGLPMTTRCGNLDPGAVLYMIDEIGLSSREVTDILYHKSGLAGLSGLSGDMREIMASDSPDATIAAEYFVRRTAMTIASMAAAAGGMETLIFTGGIGEHIPEIRRRIEERLRWCGVEPEAIDASGEQVSRDDAKVAIYVLCADEELMLARHAHECTVALAAKGRATHAQ